MPRYFFHIEGDSDVVDCVGVLLPDASAARDRAIETASSLLVGVRESRWDGAMRVVDEKGENVLWLQLRSGV